MFFSFFSETSLGLLYKFKDEFELSTTLASIFLLFPLLKRSCYEQFIDSTTKQHFFYFTIYILLSICEILIIFEVRKENCKKDKFSERVSRACKCEVRLYFLFSKIVNKCFSKSFFIALLLFRYFPTFEHSYSSFKALISFLCSSIFKFYEAISYRWYLSIINKP